MGVESTQSQVEEADSLSQVSEMTSEEGEVESSNMSTGGGGGGGGMRRRTVGVHFTSVDSRDLLREDDAAGAPASVETTVETVTTVEVSRNNPPRAHTLRASSPAHRRNKESPLSSDAIFHQSHAGLFNLCIVVLVAVNSRLIIENLMKYGLLINSGFWISSKSARDWPLFMCGLSLPIFPFLALLAEKMKAKSNISEGVILVLHLIIITTEIVYPAYVIHRVQSAMLPGLILILIALTGGMKLFSYAHTNNDMREILKAEEKPEPLQLTEHVVQLTEHVEYPDNLTVENMSYFMLAPTLCYQLGYPRSETVRKGWVLRQVGKLAVFLGLIGFIIEQYISPTVIKSQHPLKGNYLYAAERILKLSMPVLYVWLCLFYCLFHLWLNIVAELLRFGDREFYKDWWNAKTVEEYWRMWNMPVHKWMVRHIYFPSIRLGLSKGVAVFLVFVISALFHEVAIGVPCHMLRCWAFLGIMFQVPLVYLTNLIQDRYRNSMVGNMVFWFFFCIVGQPMCLLLYYHDVVNSTPSK